MIRTFGSGARRLLDYMQASEEHGEVRERWEALWAAPSFVAWVRAYGRGIEQMEEGMRGLLREPERATELEPAFFWQAIARGFEKARQPEINARCRRTLDTLLKVDTRSIESAVLALLPPETPLEIELHLTVDNFNTGMFLGQEVFLSVLKILPEQVSSVVAGLGHEFHHVGAHYWFERNSQLQQLRSQNAGGQLVAGVIEYLVSEGLANAFFSPHVLDPLSETTEEARAHNARLQELEARWPEDLIQKIEALLMDALMTSDPEELDRLNEEFRTLSLDRSGSGLPAGHFAAGRMVRRITSAFPQERVVALVQAPWKLFGAYNEAVAAQAPRFSARWLATVEECFRSGG